MAVMNEEGQKILAYVRAKWRRPLDPALVEHAGCRLGEAVRSRVDALGMDDKALLAVAPENVISALHRLETSEV